MLIYEKFVDGVRHLFGTLENAPSEDDIQLTYKNADGEVVTDLSAFKFFYGTKEVLFAGESDRQLVTDEDTQISVWLGDEAILGVAEDATEEVEEEVVEEPVVEEPQQPATTVATTSTRGRKRKTEEATTVEEVQE